METIGSVAEYCSVMRPDELPTLPAIGLGDGGMCSSDRAKLGVYCE